MRSGVKPFSEGAGLADGNAVKGEGAKEAYSNEEDFVEVRKGIDPDIGLWTETKRSN